VVKRWEPDVVLVAIAFCATAPLLAGVANEVVLGVWHPLDPDYRFSGTLHPNEQGFSCVVLALAALAAGKSQPRPLRRALRAVFVGAVVFLLLTRSRTAMACLVMGLACQAWLTWSTRRKIVVGYVACVAACVGALVSQGALFEKVFAVLSRNGDGLDTLTGRVPLWDELMRYVAARPLAGYGFESFWTTARIDRISGDLHWGVGAAHSAYIEMLLTIGVLGCLLHTAILVAGFGRSVMAFRRTAAPHLAFIASLFLIYMVVGVTECITLVKTSPSGFYFGFCLLLLCQEDFACGAANSAAAVPDDSPLEDFGPGAPEATY
jgi:O-antigen ligase